MDELASKHNTTIRHGLKFTIRCKCMAKLRSKYNVTSLSLRPTMPRIECLGCKRILTGYELRPYSVEYVYCERCYKNKVGRLEVVIEGLQADVQRASENEKTHHLRSKQCDFLSTWDEETMSAPHTDITLRASDGLDVYAHRAVLVRILTVNPHSLYVPQLVWA